MSHRFGLAVFAVAALALCAAASQASQEAPNYDTLAHDILADLVAANTAPSGGYDTRGAVAGLVARLRDAGFGDDEIVVIGQTDELANLVVRYRSPQPVRQPILMMAHLDVVEALAADWTVEPFTMSEKDGYYYGRGTTDNKAGAAMLIANLIRYRFEGFEPDRDLIVMLTADEESTGDAALWLTTEKRELIDAQFALNTDGGLVILEEDRPRAFMMQTSEKLYVSFALEALDPGGHSSLPRADSAISRLARVLVDLAAYRFPIDLNDTTREFFSRWARFAPEEQAPLIEWILDDDRQPMERDRLADVPYFNALARTTCVATELSGGHAENALPQSARAVVNCRVLPQSSAAAAKSLIESMAEPQGVTVSQLAVARTSPPSPLDAHIVGPVTAVSNELWPGIPVIPEMSTGATDGLFVRNAGIPVYGVSGVAEDPDDIRAHGQDERIGVQSYRDATKFWYRLVKAMASSHSAAD